MLDRKFILENVEAVKLNCKNRNVVADVDRFVELENSCEGLIPVNTLDGYFTFNERSMTLNSTRKTYKLGDQIKVKIKDTDIITRRIYMSIV